MSKILLFVCLALFGAYVYGQTQIRFVNARYDSSYTLALAANLDDYPNTTVASGIKGNYDMPVSGGGFKDISATLYLAVPQYSFQVNQSLTLYVIEKDTTAGQSAIASANFTLQEGQSYSFVYVDTTIDVDPYVTLDSPLLLGFEERPTATVPYGKALVRIVNVAVSTYSSSDMPVTLTGAGVAEQDVSIPFGQASEFLVYDSAVELTLSITLPIQDATINLTRTITFNTTIDKTTVIYIRGDLGDGAQQGMLVTAVDFPPAPPMDIPVAPMAATPMADTPVAVPVASGPVAAPVRAPVKRTSSAAQTVAQIAGVAGLMSLLF